MRIFAHHADRGGKREIEWTGAASLPRPEEVEQALEMDEEIREGDWIEWTGSAGKQQGKVGSVDEDGYGVSVRTGENS